MSSARRNFTLFALLLVAVLLGFLSLSLLKASVTPTPANFIRSHLNLTSSQCPTSDHKIQFWTDLTGARITYDAAFDAIADGVVNVSDSIALNSAMGEIMFSCNTNPHSLAECEDGIDNDGDGRVDAAGLLPLTSNPPSADDLLQSVNYHRGSSTFTTQNFAPGAWWSSVLSPAVVIEKRVENQEPLSLSLPERFNPLLDRETITRWPGVQRPLLLFDAENRYLYTAINPYKSQMNARILKVDMATMTIVHTWEMTGDHVNFLYLHPERPELYAVYEKGRFKPSMGNNTHIARIETNTLTMTDDLKLTGNYLSESAVYDGEDHLYLTIFGNQASSAYLIDVNVRNFTQEQETVLVTAQPVNAPVRADILLLDRDGGLHVFTNRNVNAGPANGSYSRIQITAQEHATIASNTLASFSSILHYDARSNTVYGITPFPIQGPNGTMINTTGYKALQLHTGAASVKQREDFGLPYGIPQFAAYRTGLTAQSLDTRCLSGNGGTCYQYANERGPLYFIPFPDTGCSSPEDQREE